MTLWNEVLVRTGVWRRAVIEKNAVITLAARPITIRFFVNVM